MRTSICALPSHPLLFFPFLKLLPHLHYERGVRFRHGTHGVTSAMGVDAYGSVTVTVAPTLHGKGVFESFLHYPRHGYFGLAIGGAVAACEWS